MWYTEVLTDGLNGENNGNGIVGVPRFGEDDYDKVHSTT